MSVPPESSASYPDGGPAVDGGAHPNGYRPYAGHAGLPTDPASPYASPAPGYATGAPPSSNARTFGWIGVVVLYALAIWQLVIPTVRTLVASLTSGSPLGGEQEFVGLDNMSRVAGMVLPGMAVMALVVLPVTIAAAALGLGIGSGMTPHQRLAVPTRIVVGVLSALFVPLGIGISRFLSTGFGETPTQAMVLMITTVTLSALPLLTAGFSAAFAVVLTARSPGRGVALVLLIGLTGAVAIGVQMLDLPLTVPVQGQQVPMVVAYQTGFQRLDIGAGAAASTLVLVVAGVLGVVAMLAVLLSRPRLVVPDGQPQTLRSGVVGLVVAVLAAVGGLVLVGPFLIGSLSTGSISEVQPLAVTLRTWIPAAVGTVAQVAIAVLGGAAIGWCRPAGHRSLWLLMPLAPWLFVGETPLMIMRFLDARESDSVNTWVGLVPGPSVVVAAVLVLALLFFGWGQRPTPRQRVATGAAVLGIGGVLLLLHAQSLFPALVMAFDPDLQTAPMAVVMFMNAYGYGGDMSQVLGLLYPIPMFLVIAAIGVLAQLGTRYVTLQRD